MSSTTMPLKDGLLLHVIASGLAGIISTSKDIYKFYYAYYSTFSLAICSPADVIKSRVMAQKVCTARTYHFTAYSGPSLRRTLP